MKEYNLATPVKSAVLGRFSNLNYKEWWAIAEFVDNSIQSFDDNYKKIKKLNRGGKNLEVKIILKNSKGNPTLEIIDNAAGIKECDYERAFSVADLPPDRSNLNEFGMGMKTAGCWFGDYFTVTTTAIGESLESTAHFDVKKMSQQDPPLVKMGVRKVAANSHYTAIKIKLRNVIASRTQTKIKSFIGDIYRMYILDGRYKIYFNEVPLAEFTPNFLTAPYYPTRGSLKISEDPKLSKKNFKWIKKINRQYIDKKKKLSYKANVYISAEYLKTKKTSGLHLFRRKRLVKGGDQEAWKPQKIFGSQNERIYNRLCGEIVLEGPWTVSHTKDNIIFEGNQEEELIDSIYEQITQPGLPLRQQCNNYSSVGVEQKKDLEEQVRQVHEDLKKTNPVNLVEALVTNTKPKFKHNVTPAPNTIEETSNSLFPYEQQINDWILTVNDTTDARNDLFSVIADHDRKIINITIKTNHSFWLKYVDASSRAYEPILRIIIAVCWTALVMKQRGNEVNIDDLCPNISDTLLEYMDE